jgi:hypothetical protein
LDLVKTLKESRAPRQKYVIGVGGPSACANKQRFLEAGANFTCSNLRFFAEQILPQVELKGTYSEQNEG